MEMHFRFVKVMAAELYVEPVLLLVIAFCYGCGPTLCVVYLVQESPVPSSHPSDCCLVGTELCMVPPLTIKVYRDG